MRQPGFLFYTLSRRSKVGREILRFARHLHISFSVIPDSIGDLGALPLVVLTARSHGVRLLLDTCLVEGRAYNTTIFEKKKSKLQNTQNGFVD